MSVSCNFKWVLPSQKLNKLKNGNQLTLKKFICKYRGSDWTLKIVRKTANSFGLVIEGENKGKNFKHVVHIQINLYTRKPKQHILRKSFKELLLSKNSVELRLGSCIQEMVVKSTASIISGSIFINENYKAHDLKTKFEDIATEASEELCSNLSKFCCNHLFSDIILTCNTKNFPAHKLILAASCPYFAELFQNSEKSQIDITDLKPDVLTAMLGYIYSAKTEQLTQELACELLIASITYKLYGLRVICVNYLRSILTVENVIPIYILAIATDEKLEMRALNYMSSNFSSIENTNEWKTFLKEKPTVALQILSSIVKSVD